ncbi:CsxC family protein [Clostridium sp. DL1XJH146]
MIKNDSASDVEYENWEENDGNESCTSKVLNSTTMPCCTNRCMPPHVRTPHPFVAKVPVVKKICCVNINVKSFIKIEKTATDIKNIDKEVCITQCTLCPIYTPYMDCKYDNYQLFLEGYVKKNIRYCHPTCEKEGKTGCISGDVLCTTCKIPFECSTNVKLSSSCENKNEPSFQDEFEMLDNNKLCKDSNKKHLINYTNYSDQPYCELVNYIISECDFLQRPSEEGNFKKLEEKMVVSVTLRVMQNEEMYIKNQPEMKYEEHEEECEDC